MNRLVHCQPGLGHPSKDLKGLVKLTNQYPNDIVNDKKKDYL